MSSFEWMELQTLTSDIAGARSRLVEARTTKDQRLTRALEEEIAAAEARRVRLLSHITSDLATAPEQNSPAAPADEPADGPGAALAVEPPDEAEPAALPPEPAEPIAAAGVAPPTPVVAERASDGAAIAWDRLTPGDIAAATTELAARRAEILARQATELAALDAARGELDTLDQAIEAFTRKFAAPLPGAAIVQLDEEREMRLQGRA